MTVEIRPLSPADIEPVVRLSLRAWAPAFASMEVQYGEMYRWLRPDGLAGQDQAVRDVLAADGAHTWVADHAGDQAVGFVSVQLVPDQSLGVIEMIAVDPEHQHCGVGASLTRFAVDWMREAGMHVAMVETGGDAGHAPARRLYESAGFRDISPARYWMSL